jgi:hypothetical protein
MMVAGLRIGVRASEGYVIWSALDDRDGPALSLLKVTVALPTFYRECFMNIIDLDLPSRRPICGGKEWKRIV